MTLDWEELCQFGLSIGAIKEKIKDVSTLALLSLHYCAFQDRCSDLIDKSVKTPGQAGLPGSRILNPDLSPNLSPDLLV